MSVFEYKLLKDSHLPIQSDVLSYVDVKGVGKRQVDDDPYKGCESASLRLSKFVRLGDAEVRRTTIDKRGGRVERTELRPSKADEIHSIAQRYGNGYQLFGPQDNRLPVIRPKGCVEFFAKTEANLAINLAGGILEGASISLHRHFNTVRLPGSALKGIASAYAYRQWLEKNEQGDTKGAQEVALQMGQIFGKPTGHKRVDKLLGDEVSSGTVSFMDAYPQNSNTLVEDILTCHHMKYYGDSDPAAQALDNEQKINPVPFLSLRRGVLFAFSLAPLRNANEEDVCVAKSWLIGALTQLGLGAKTAAGYGWFSYDETLSVQEIVKRQETEKQFERKRQEAEAKRLEEEKKREEAKRKAEREQMLAPLSPEERLKKWILEDWKRQNFLKDAFVNHSKEEQIIVLKLMRNDDEVKACWITIKDKAEKGKKKEKERFLPLQELLRQLAKQHKNEIGGKLP